MLLWCRLNPETHMNMTKKSSKTIRANKRKGRHKSSMKRQRARANSRP